MSPREEEVSSTTVSITAGLALGLIAAIDAWRHARRGSARGTGGLKLRATRRSPIGDVLVAAQVAMAQVLLTGSGLLLHSFWKLTRVEPRFRSDSFLTLSVFLTARSIEASPTDSPMSSALSNSSSLCPAFDRWRR